MFRLRPLRLALPLAAAVAAAAWLLWPAAPGEPWRAATVFGEQARPLPAFALADHAGRPLGPDDFAGRWSLLFFGYAQCPDICAPTLQRLSAALDRLDEPRARIVFVSVDPGRDTPAALAGYVAHFRPGTLGATGEPAAVAALMSELGAYAARRELAAGYLIDHSAAVWLVDPEARLAGVFTPPHDPDAIAADLRRLRAARS